MDNNHLTGAIPVELTKLQAVQTLSLRGNQLSGALPTFLSACVELRVLDLRQNNLYGTLDSCWFLPLSNLKVLALGSNSISGSLPSCLGNFSKYLQVVDLSKCKLSGTIPDHLELQAFRLPATPGATKAALAQSYDESFEIIAKGQYLKYTYLLSLVTSLDFSENELTGSIPPSIGSLTGMVFLNLSENHLNGSIPSSLAKLQDLQSLDLSRNNLSGTIPPEFSQYLTFLSFLNLSYNQLSGLIPQGNQFLTFTNDSYLGNKGLCGAPLSQQCEMTSNNQTSSPTTNSKTSGLVHRFKEAVEIDGVVVGYIIGLVGMLAILIKWKAWPHRLIRCLSSLNCIFGCSSER